MTVKAGRRVFRTVLFTDMVGSTELAAQLGDKRWRRTVAGHHALIRRELKRNHGTEVDTAGDGFFAIFENPTDAIRCAAAVVAGVHGLGLRIRAAIHTGEVEPAGDKVGGIAVHIAARLLAMAGLEQVIVSGTVRDLVAGAGYEFEDRGTHELRGVPGEWHVYALVLPQLDEGIAVGAADDLDEQRAATIRRQRIVVGGLLAVIAVLVGGVVLALVLGARPAQIPSGPDTVVAFDRAQASAVRGWHVGRGPEALAFGSGVLWVASAGSGTVSRVDVAEAGVLAVGQGLSRPSAAHVFDGRVWVADRYSSRVAVLDAQGNLVDRIEQHAAAMAGLAGRMWLADDLHDRLVAVDNQTFGDAGVIELPAPTGVSDLAASGSALWAAAPRSNALLRVDPASGTVTAVPTAVDGVRGVASHADDVWLISPATDTLARLDATAARVDLRVTVCDLPVAVSAVADGAWVVCARDLALWFVGRNGDVGARLELNAVPADVVADGDRVWVALRAD